MKLAVITEDSHVYVEIPADKFRAGLKEYYNEFGDIDIALNKLESDIKELAKRK